VNSVLDALLESLEGLKLRFGPTPESFASDRAQTGDTREHSVSDLLRSYFPSTWTVGKGPIYDTFGGVSNSIDSVLCSPSHPPMQTGKRTVLLAEGVHSATETKPDLTTHTKSSELHRGLAQIASVKRLRRELHDTAFHEDALENPERHRIPCALFTAKIGDAESAIHYMEKFKETEGASPHDLPDLLIALDYGVILHTADARYGQARWLIAKRASEPVEEAYLLLPETGHRILAWYLHLLYGFAAPELYIVPPILRLYMRSMSFPEGWGVWRVTKSS